MLGGQRYLPVPDKVPAELAVSRRARARCSSSPSSAGSTAPASAAWRRRSSSERIAAREYQANNPDGSDELRTPYVVDDKLDLSAWARDALVLALPDKILCRPDCAGLCPVCGKDLNVEWHTHDDVRARSALGRAGGAPRQAVTSSPAPHAPSHDGLIEPIPFPRALRAPLAHQETACSRSTASASSTAPTRSSSRSRSACPPGARIGVVGPNGVGKSTLLRIAAGLEEPDAGTVARAPGWLTVGYMAQEQNGGAPLSGGPGVAEGARRGADGRVRRPPPRRADEQPRLRGARAARALHADVIRRASSSSRTTGSSSTGRSRASSSSTSGRGRRRSTRAAGASTRPRATRRGAGSTRAGRARSRSAAASRSRRRACGSGRSAATGRGARRRSRRT